MWRSLSCGNISPHDRFLHISPHTHILLQNHVESFLYVIDFLHISHVEKLLHMTICHMEKFLHMTDFFSTTTGCDGCDKYQVCPPLLPPEEEARAMLSAIRLNLEMPDCSGLSS